jgi:O-antigen ligase
VITRRQRTFIVSAAVAAIVVAALTSHGAYFSQSWGWVALAFLVPSSILLILDRVSAPGRFRTAFASLVGALGVWVALSMIWSISPSGSAREVERMLVYVSVALAISLVLRRGDGPAVAGGTLVGVCAITLYALGTRLLPDRFDTSEDATNAYRLAEPLGYWNALGLVAAIAILLAIGAVAHARRASAAMIAGAVLPVLVMALYFAFSRGSWLALFVGFAATISLDPRRITVLWTILVVAAPSAVGVAIASRQDALTGNPNTTATDFVTEGHRLAWLLTVLIPSSAVLAWIAHRVARRVSVGPRVRRGVAGALTAVALGAFGAAVLVAGGPTSALNDIRERYEAPADSGSNLNDRLFQFSGTGRGEMIAVAWDFGLSHPVGGTGAGTFEILWYEHRPSTEVVRDAHFLYIETFNELGLVGLALLTAALAVPLIAGVRARRSRFVAPSCGAFLAWVSASALDWHWEMVALTTTALLTGSVGLLAAERRSHGALMTGTRLAMIGLTGTLSLLAVWSLVGNQALFAGRDALKRKDWSEARDHAHRAQALLLWSHEPDVVRGDAAAGLGDREGALRAYRGAVREDPRNWIAWLRLARVARGAESDAAYDQVRELNPRVEGLPGE